MATINDRTNAIYREWLDGWQLTTTDKAKETNRGNLDWKDLFWTHKESFMEC